MTCVEDNCKCRCEEEFSKQRSCPYAQHIVTFEEVPWFPSGTKVVPCHRYYCHSTFGGIMNKEKDDMKKIDRLPRFMPGQVIDLSYKHKGLPNRILIKTVYTREQDKGWMYAVYLENTGERTALDEDFIISHMTTKSTQVYRSPDVIKLYNDGWRFCGNFDKDTAFDMASKCATNIYIKDIILKPALNAKGCLVNNQYGMWIRYNTIINDNGTITGNTEDSDVIVIK